VEQVACDFVLAGIAGAAGLPATVAAVAKGLRVGLANKEALVVAGSLIMPLARQRGATLLPVDSEHSAIFQALQAGKSREVHRVYLTASGGPFRTWPAERMARATVAEALNHPTWDMGPKITIDSATMMNKALEIIEARWLFDLSSDQIEVLIHPESIVHSMVEFCDGSVIAQLGCPDMRTPIQYALTFPDRRAGCSRRLHVSTIGTMRFEPPDFARFGALRLGYEAAGKRGTAGAVLNAANEAAVELFRAGKIRFGQITELVGSALRAHEVLAEPNLQQLLAADAWARQYVRGVCGGRGDPVESHSNVS
jgi:1-deoxy-D-xylulose-5-phosphate reductoisomerase